jgi:hypothetical protein
LKNTGGLIAPRSALMELDICRLESMTSSSVPFNYECASTSTDNPLTSRLPQAILQSPFTYMLWVKLDAVNRGHDNVRSSGYDSISNLAVPSPTLNSDEREKTLCDLRLALLIPRRSSHQPRPSHQRTLQRTLLRFLQFVSTPGCSSL